MSTNEIATNDFDITIFGQPVIDHVITTHEPFRYGELMKICSVAPEGELQFKEGSWIQTRENDEEYFFGMPLIDANGERSLILLPGKKVTVARLQRGNVVASTDLFARLGRPFIYLGGGGPNVLQVLNNVFGKLSIEFVGAYAPMAGGSIDPSVRCVFEMLPHILQHAQPQPRRSLQIAPIYENVPVNIIIEGMLGNGEQRGILKSPYSERLIEKAFVPQGRCVMVNTVYSKTLAVNALCCAIEPDRFGVIALTESLCNNQDPFNSEEQRWIEGYLLSRGMRADFNRIRTVYDFILAKIIPEGPAVLIMNESEFDHILNPKGQDESNIHPVTGRPKAPILEKLLVHLDSVLGGFKAFRELQPNKKSRLYLTLDVHGSLCLDENDIVHYSPVTQVEGLAGKGKNAIGDTYAAMVTAGEYISRFKKPVELPYILSAAAAAADARFYSGFDAISPATVDEYIIKTVTNYRDNLEQANYHDLGPLDGLREELKVIKLEGAPHVRLGDIKRKDWFNVLGRGRPRMVGHYSLQDKKVSYGMEWLTLRMQDGIR